MSPGNSTYTIRLTLKKNSGLIVDNISNSGRSQFQLLLRSPSRTICTCIRDVISVTWPDYKVPKGETRILYLYINIFCLNGVYDGSSNT